MNTIRQSETVQGSASDDNCAPYPVVSFSLSSFLPRHILLSLCFLILLSLYLARCPPPFCCGRLRTGKSGQSYIHALATVTRTIRGIHAVMVCHRPASGTSLCSLKVADHNSTMARAAFLSEDLAVNKLKLCRAQQPPTRLLSTSLHCAGRGRHCGAIFGETPITDRWRYGYSKKGRNLHLIIGVSIALIDDVRGFHTYTEVLCWS